MFALSYVMFFLDFTECLIIDSLDITQQLIYAWQTDLLYAIMFIAIGIDAIQQVKLVIAHHKNTKEILK